MNMKNADILAITRIYTKNKQDKDREEIKLPAAIAWKRRVNMDKVFKAKAIIDEAMQELSQKYADDEHSEEKKDENGDTMRTVKPEYLAEYTKAQVDILSQETDVDIKKVKIEDLGDIDLSDDDLDTLAFMIEEE